MRERLSTKELERQHQLFEHRLELGARDPHLRMVLEVADVRRVWLALEELREWRAQEQHVPRQELARFQTAVQKWESIVKRYFDEGDEDE